MYGRIHPNLDIDLYLLLEEFEEISTLGLEKVLSCELPTLLGSNSGRKAFLQCEDLKEPNNTIRLEHKEGNYFIKIARDIPNPADERGHFGQTNEISVTVYIFSQSVL